MSFSYSKKVVKGNRKVHKGCGCRLLFRLHRVHKTYAADCYTHRTFAVRVFVSLSVVPKRTNRSFVAQERRKRCGCGHAIWRIRQWRCILSRNFFVLFLCSIFTRKSPPEYPPGQTDVEDIAHLLRRSTLGPFTNPMHAIESYTA